MGLCVFQKGLFETIRNSHNSMWSNDKYEAKYTGWDFIYPVALSHLSNTY